MKHKNALLTWLTQIDSHVLCILCNWGPSGSLASTTHQCEQWKAILSLSLNLGQSRKNRAWHFQLSGFASMIIIHTHLALPCCAWVCRLAQLVSLFLGLSKSISSILVSTKMWSVIQETPRLFCLSKDFGSWYLWYALRLSSLYCQHLSKSQQTLI